MRKKNLILLLCVFLVLALVLSGCPFRRPVPQRRPAPEPLPRRERPEQPRTQPPPDQPGPAATDLANRIADIATNVEGVDQSVVVVISNLALVGITIERGAAGREVEIKREVATRIENREPSIVNAYVSANPDIVRQLREISRGIQRGEPISTFFEQITEVLQRMRAEQGNQ